jgi:hypothetical protein
MLTNEEIDEIEKKFESMTMTFDDLYLLESHIFEIGEVQDEYGDGIPHDVAVNLNADLERIISICTEFLKKQGVYSFPKKGVDNEQ